jgi:hypothetical protein
MKRLRAAFASLGLLSAVIVSSACNQGSGPNAPSNNVHGSRCLMDTDCMGGYECSKGKSDILGECISRLGAATSGAGNGGAAAKPAGSAAPAAGKPADGTQKPKPTTPEPLPPPKPPKDPKPQESNFSP